MSFQFKQFSIDQTVNAHKVGTDSMVLGAWIKGDFKHILDIGTGTGILALMQAQNHPDANIIGIEPNEKSCQEAESNFKNSPFNNRLNTENSSLQKFNSDSLFDLIICNPPYFVDSSLSDDQSKNSARHTIDLSILELYKYAYSLLADKGQLSLVIPTDISETHVSFAKANKLFPSDILIIENEDGKAIRHVITFKKQEGILIEQSMIVKYASGLYSKAYVELTSEFHNRMLPFQK